MNLTVRPNSDIAPAWDNPISGHYLQLIDGLPLTAVSTLALATDKYGIPPLPSFVASLVSVTAVAAIQSATGAGRVRALLWNGAALTTGATWTAPIAGTTATAALAPPGGGSWTPAKFAACDLWLECTQTGFGEVTCSELSLLCVVTVTIDVERRRVVFPAARRPIEVPGERSVVACPVLGRRALTSPGARVEVVHPTGRRSSIAAGPSSD